MQAEQQLTFGSYRFDLQNGQLWRGKQEARLTPKAAAVLRYLVERAGQVVTKEELFAAVWPDTVVSDAALTTCIQEVRQALRDDARHPRYIETVHRRGFRFLEKVVSRQEEESQNATGENGLESSVQRLESNGQGFDSVMPALGPNSGQAPAGIQEPQAPASPDPPWIPAFAGMTQPPATPQNRDPSPHPAQTLDPQRQTLDGSPPTRLWSSSRLILVAVLLLIGIVLTVHYLSRSTLSTQDSALRTDAAPQALALPDKPSIVVLPFTNLSGDPGQDYFSDGLTDVLTGRLSTISRLFVIARNSAFTYKGKAVKVQDVSKEMGVRYVLQGSVHRADQRVRITAQLIDATTGYHLWSEQYDRPLQDLFALQDEIVQKIVTTLKLQLTLQEQGYIVRKHTDNLEAYDALLRGLEDFWRLTKEANTQARQMYEKALALDPQYAEAYAWLSLTYIIEWAWRWSADSQILERALALAQQAIALDDSLPIAHSSLSNVYAQKQQYDQAIAEGERAIALDPNNANSYVSQADVLNLAGRPEQALQAVEHAMRLNPRYPPNYLVELGWAYRWTGRYAEAIATLKEALSRNPNFIPVHNVLASSYLFQWLSQQSPAAQTLEPAMEAVQRALALNDSFNWAHICLGYISLYQQQYEHALAEIEQAVALAPTEAWSYAALAEVLSRGGRTEDALEAAAQALRLKPNIADDHLGSVGIAYALAGRYEEARAPLQRYLSRYPNILPYHLVLAAVYSELGQTAEARAEVAEVLRLNPNFSLEVHKQRAPIKDPAVLERHIAALRKAGLK